MGYESLLFVATPSELSSCFSGWKPALDPPRVEKGKDPFTGKPMTVVIDTVEYDDDEEVDGSPDWDQLGVGRPSIAQGVSTSLLNGLAEALKLKGRPLRRALSEPPGSEMTVWRVEPSFVASWSKSVQRARDLFVSSGASKPHASKTAQRLAEVGAAAIESGAGVYLVEQI